MTVTVKKNQQPLTGKVLSNKMDKTVVVRVDDIIKHTTYQKYIKQYRKFLAHDETNQCQVGDVVVISQAKPYSRRKAWRVDKIIETVKG